MFRTLSIHAKIVTVLAALTVLCSLGNSAAASDQKGNNTVPILTAVSGFESCSSDNPSPYEMPMAARVASIRRTMLLEGKARRVEWVLGCYGRSSQYLYYVSSLDPVTVYKGNQDDLTTEIVTLAARHYQNHEVYLIGHSWGGWSVMKAAASLPAWVRIRFLATLDPISITECSSRDILRSRLSPGFTARHAACRRAPSDLTPQHDRIRSRVRYWLNIFQDKSSSLQSASIDAADLNVQQRYPCATGVDAHSDMESAQWAFNVIEGKIRSLAD